VRRYGVFLHSPPSLLFIFLCFFFFFSCCFCCCALRPNQELRQPSSSPISLHFIAICSPLYSAAHLLKTSWVFRSSFLKTRSSLFSQFPSITRHSTLFLGLLASQRHLLRPDLTTTCQCVDLMHLRVDLTF
jgi:hypothetical protein